MSNVSSSRTQQSQHADGVAGSGAPAAYAKVRFRARLTGALQRTKPVASNDHVLDGEKIQTTKVAWGPVAATVWAIIIYILPQILIGSLLSIYPLLKHWSSAHATDWLNNSIPAQFVYTVLVEAIAIGIIWLLLRHYRTKFATIGLKRARLQDALYAIIGCAIYLVLYLLLVGVLTHLIPSFNSNQQQDVGFSNATATWSLVMAFISLVILPPLAEELIFRGFVFTGFRRTFGFAISAIGTSLLFAVPHLFESSGSGLLWIAGVDTFVLSLVLCFLREKTGRLWAGMGVHALKNCLAFATIFIFHVH